MEGLWDSYALSLSLSHRVCHIYSVQKTCLESFSEKGTMRDVSVQ